MATKLKTTTASGSNLMSQADEYRQNIDSHLSEIQTDIAAINESLFGDKGFAVAKAKAVFLRPTLSQLAAWVPGDENNDMESAVVHAHNASGGLNPPSVVGAFKDALYLAVHAADKDVANEARMGRDAKGNLNVKRQYKVIMPQSYGDAAGRFNLKDAAEAKSKLTAKANDAAKLFKGMTVPVANASPADKAAYRDAKDIADMWAYTVASGTTMEGLRWLAAKIAAFGVSQGRWRNLLYMNVCVDALSAFEKKATSRPIGEVWDPALGRAKAAHKAWVASQLKGITDEKERTKAIANLPANKDSLDKAMAEAVTEYLEPMETGEKAASKLTPNEQAAKKLFDAVRLCQRQFSIKKDKLLIAVRQLTRPYNDEGLVDGKETDDDKKDLGALVEVVAARTDTAKVAAAIDADTDTAKAKRQTELAAKAATKAKGPTKTKDAAPTFAPGATRSTVPVTVVPKGKSGLGARLKGLTGK